LDLQMDSPEWRVVRDTHLQRWVADPAAIQFFWLFSDTCELFDDLIDKDKPIEDEHVIRVLFNVLTVLPFNAFFEAHKQKLVPVIITGINAWLDANKLEKGGENDQVFSYVLRGWYMELLLFMISLTRGIEYMRSVSMEVRHFFTWDESLEQYKADLKRAALA